MIVDLAAERGGNCELTRPGETVVEHGVTDHRARSIFPPRFPITPARCTPATSSTFLKNMMTKEGALNIDLNDEITRESLVARDGEMVNPRVQELLGATCRQS